MTDQSGDQEIILNQLTGDCIIVCDLQLGISLFCFFSLLFSFQQFFFSSPLCSIFCSKLATYYAQDFVQNLAT